MIEVGMRHLILISLILFSTIWPCRSTTFNSTHRNSLRLQVKEMFMHAFNNYKLIGEHGEFKEAVKQIIQTVSFDTDVVVSVFETNIRVVGGLLGGHFTALEAKKLTDKFTWYSDQLLDKAVDIANRLLPAFDTSTGMPFPRINLRHGTGGLMRHENHTCTACAGTMILEFAALSRLTGNPVYEEKAARALACLWKQRNRESNLVGTVINVQTGNWVGRDSGVGAGIDSYYEYLLKAYVAFGEPVYYHRFLTHYQAVDRFVSGPSSASPPFYFVDVLMHKPSQRTKPYMDALLAFWPGLQVLAGDVKSAVALHEFLYQVHQHNKLLPEAFTVDMEVHWGQYLLRPEFIESTYLLFKATNDPYYLEVGAKLVHSLQHYSRVECGFAAIEDVRTMRQLDQMDSFFLAETLKYLYLLFSEPSQLPIPDLDRRYLFTTEAHLLPLDLLRTTERSSSMLNSNKTCDVDHHGDRDHATEYRLHSTSQCRAFADGGERDHLSDLSDADDDSRECKSDPLSTTSNEDVCTLEENPKLIPHTSSSRYYNLLLSWLSLRSSTTKSTPSSSSHCRLERVRQPIRRVASILIFNHQQEQAAKASSTSSSSSVLPLTPADFRPTDPLQIALLRRMGIELSIDATSRVVVRHSEAAAEDSTMAYAGLVFVNRLFNLTQSQQPGDGASDNSAPPTQPNYVTILDDWPHLDSMTLTACPASFASPSSPEVKGPLRLVRPWNACSSLDPIGYNWLPMDTQWWSTLLDPASQPEPDWDAAASIDSLRGPLSGSIALVRRGGCLFVEKAKRLAEAGVLGAIVVDLGNESDGDLPAALFTMSGDENASPTSDQLDIAFVMLLAHQRDQLFDQMARHWHIKGQPAFVLLTTVLNATASFESVMELHKINVSPTVFNPILLKAVFLLPEPLPSQQQQSRHRLYFDREAAFAINVATEEAPSVWLLSFYFSRATKLSDFWRRQEEEQERPKGAPINYSSWFELLQFVAKFTNSSQSCSSSLRALFNLAALSQQHDKDLSSHGIVLSPTDASHLSSCLSSIQLQLEALPEDASSSPELPEMVEISIHVRLSTTGGASVIE